MFVNRSGALRNGWWIALFFAVLALLLFPTLLISARFHHEISIWEQIGLIVAATLAVQGLRRKPFREVTGALDLRFLRDLGAGLFWGFVLMIAPAALLWIGGWVRFDAAAFNPLSLAAGVAAMAGVAVAEELLFRGFLFQRLVAGIGVWPAQVGIGLLFVLTHLGNPGMHGQTLALAGTNIFLASVLFGQARLRTRSLALPIGMHFMANVTQGVLLGFGVSGNAEAGLLAPERLIEADWLTGGSFGLEASAPGLITLAVLLAWFLLHGRREPGRAETAA